MPLNCEKRCSLCGKKGHNVRACNIKGADKYRELLASQRGSNRLGSARVLRGTGEAAKRKIVNKRPASESRLSRQARCKRARLLYSGDSGVPKRKARTNEFPPMPALDPDSAVAELEKIGAIIRPPRCPKCDHGGLQGPFAHHKLTCGETRAYYCDNKDCAQPTNVLAFCPLVMTCFQRARSCTPSKLWSFLLAFFQTDAPRNVQCMRISGLGEKPCAKLMQCLRAIEAKLARRQLLYLRLTGRLEVDATRVRTAYVSAKNAAWQPHVRIWKELHPRLAVPKYFL